MEHVMGIAQLLIQRKSTIGTLKYNKIYPVSSISHLALVTLTFDNPNTGNKRFTLYTFARIVSCSKYSSLTDFLEVRKTWGTWDDISALANHQIVKEYLMDCLTSIGEMHGTQGHDHEVKPYYQRYL